MPPKNRAYYGSHITDAMAYAITAGAYRTQKEMEHLKNAGKILDAFGGVAKIPEPEPEPFPTLADLGLD